MHSLQRIMHVKVCCTLLMGTVTNTKLVALLGCLRCIVGLKNPPFQESVLSRQVMMQLTSIPNPKKHLMPMENNSPALPMIARDSASKSQCDGLYLLA